MADNLVFKPVVKTPEQLAKEQAEYQKSQQKFQAQQKGILEPVFGGTEPNQPTTVAGYQQEKLGGLMQQNILRNQQPTAGFTAPAVPTTGLATSGMGKPPAAYANPLLPAATTAAPIGTPVGAPNISSAVNKKGLLDYTGDWYSKLSPSQQDSTNKALMAAGFNLMQTGGTTYRTPISNAALFGQAGTVGLKTYESDQAAKAKAASEAAKLKFDQEYKTAKLGLMGSRGRSGGDSGVGNKDVLKAAGTDYSNYLVGAKTKQVLGLPHDDSTAVTVGQWTYKMDKNGKLLASSPKTNKGDTVIWHDASGLTNNLKDYWTNQLHPERGGTATTGKSTGGAYLAVHDGKQGMYDPSTKMFTPL